MEDVGLQRLTSIKKDRMADDKMAGDKMKDDKMGGAEELGYCPA
jgi:hypothetical protein